MFDPHRELLSLEADLAEISAGLIFPSAARLWSDNLDALRPPASIRTHEVAVNIRKLPIDGGTGETDYSHALTPHLEAVHDACDDPTKRVVAVKGPARGGKTVAYETYVVRVGIYGPPRNMIWYAPTEPLAKRYVTERVNWMLKNHPDLYAKRSNAKVEKWNQREVDGALWEWSQANETTTRQVSAALIVADEIDGMKKSIRDAWLTLAKNRQREYGNLAKLLLASHPDAGPLFGIDAVIKLSDQRVRIGYCPSCRGRVGFAREVHKKRRAAWNMSDLLKRAKDMPKDEMLDFVAEHIRLICPHCRHAITNTERLEMRAEAEWMGLGQDIGNGGRIIGTLTPNEIAGFVIHAMDLPFDSIAECAKQWANAHTTFRETGSKADLKEVTVKTLGETMLDEDAASQPREAAAVRARLINTGYRQGTIPRGVDFLTCMVDVQEDRFVPGVIGWDRHAQSWLIDFFSQKQLEGFHDIKPGENLADWEALEFLLTQTYPFNDGSGEHLYIGKISVDCNGRPGVVANARSWFASITSRRKNPIPRWRLSLQRGDAHHEGDFIGPPREIKTDKAGRPYPLPVIERTINVYELKKIIAERMLIEEPGPLRMNLPDDITDAHVRQLCSETLINEQWIRSGPNELWDVWVGAEAGRRLLVGDRVRDWNDARPIWATPFKPSPEGSDAGMPKRQSDLFDRLKKFNQGRGGRR